MWSIGVGFEIFGASSERQDIEWEKNKKNDEADGKGLINMGRCWDDDDDDDGGWDDDDGWMMRY